MSGFAKSSWRMLFSSAATEGFRYAVFSRGTGVFGALGLKDINNHRSFARVEVPPDFEPKMVAAGKFYFFSCIANSLNLLFLGF